LPPGDNLIEMEVIGIGMAKPKGINIFFWLEGSDPHVSLLPKNRGSAYNYYTELKPGRYRLVFQPQDQEQIIGHTNRFSIEIVVLSYWYQRWWAYVLFGLSVVLLAFLALRVRIHRIHLENETWRLAELDRLKSRFFANLSHEFRTPLSLILGPVDQLETSESETSRKEQLGLIRRNAERLHRMVNLLLQFARIESGTLKLYVALRPIPPLLRRIVSSFSTAALKKGIALDIEIDPASFEGYVDAEKVEHVLENLIANGLKYTSSGGRVHVTAQRTGTELVMDVSDTGCGIAPEHLSRVFERFYRVDTSHQYEGTGIGLSLSRELVEMHHGTIDLTSSLGIGTVVKVRLPLSGYKEGEIIKSPSATAKERRFGVDQTHRHLDDGHAESGDKTIVLIAEDNDDARAYIRSHLVSEFMVMEGASGQEAFEIAKAQLPDCVVSDVMMPEMSGYELCSRLKQDERTSHIPVILLTALADTTDRIEGLQTGADDYLVKPFDANELLVRVHNLIDSRKKLRRRFGQLTTLKPGEVKVESLEDVFLKKTMDAVQTHMNDESFGAEEFARAMFMSRTQLHRKLKAITNLSATEFVRRFRMQRAKELIEKHSGTMAEIAESVGFANHSYFAHCFKEQFGVLPSEIGRK
jgi:signal transduction histidine kinase/DNA-binding response OmpR family regulator